MSLLQRAGLPQVLSITSSLMADFRRNRCIEGAGAVHFMHTRCSTVGTVQIAPPLLNFTVDAGGLGRHLEE